MISYNVIKLKHDGKENPEFKLVRPNGTADYLFLHFKSPVIFTLFNKTHELLPGTCILMSPGTPHSFYPVNCELVHDWMHFMPIDENDFLNLKIELNTFFMPTSVSFISTTIKKCEFELINKEELHQELISAEISSMLIKLKRSLNENFCSQHANALKTLRIDIYRNPENYSSTNDMAKAVNLSRSRFSVLYKEIFKVSPQKDHINARISKATHLLSFGTLSLSEISELCGYSNIYHFIRQFREITGATPGKYRKN